LPAWRRVRNFVQGEPQVADMGGFYRGLLQRLEREERLPPDALARLGTQRAQAVLAALAETGVDGTRAGAGPAAPVQGGGGRMVPLKLELGMQR
jgi:hypothetical protein